MPKIAKDSGDIPKQPQMFQIGKKAEARPVDFFVLGWGRVVLFYFVCMCVWV